MREIRMSGSVGRGLRPPYPIREWQELGRQLKKGEKGIAILVPHRRRLSRDQEVIDGDSHTDEEVTSARAVVTSVTHFGVGWVYDLAQTDGPPLPQPPRPEVVDGASDTGMRLYTDLLDYLELHGVTTARENTEPSNGYYHPFTRHVGIGLHIDGDQATRTLAHETAHMVADHLPSIERRDAETVAESAAFVVLTHYGIDSSGYTFPYVATWAQNRTVLKRNLASVQQTSHRIIASSHHRIIASSPALKARSRSSHSQHNRLRSPSSLLTSAISLMGDPSTAYDFPISSLTGVLVSCPARRRPPLPPAPASVRCALLSAASIHAMLRAE